MAWFKFGKKDDAAPLGTARSAAARSNPSLSRGKTLRGDAPAESVDAMRQKAKFRLIGSAVLVLIAVVGFPLLYDSQPRPVDINIPIEIPDKANVAPLVLPPTAVATPVAPITAPVAAPPAAPAVVVDDKASLSGKEEIVTPDKKTEAEKAAAGKSEKDKAELEKLDKAAAAKEAKAAKEAAAKEAKDKEAKDKADKAKTDKAEKDKAEKNRLAQEASKAKALLDGAPVAAKPADKPAAAETGRFIVQFGAFTDAAKSREIRQKVEKIGLKTYSQIAKNADGDLIRVRVGPFGTRAEADKAAAKIKALGLPASILTL